MRLAVGWGVVSPRLDQLLARDCPYCCGPVGRLTQHRAGHHLQVWLTCAGCGSRLVGSQPHLEHPRRFIYPAWREDLGEGPLPEEINELAHPAAPVGLGGVVGEILHSGHPLLAHVLAEAKRDRLCVAIGYELTKSDLLDLGQLVGAGSYVVAGFDAGASLMKAGLNSTALLTPYRIDDAVDWGRPTVVGRWRKAAR
jgi:hypothetical protein